MRHDNYLMVPKTHRLPQDTLDSAAYPRVHHEKCLLVSAVKGYMRQKVGDLMPKGACASRAMKRVLPSPFGVVCLAQHDRLWCIKQQPPCKTTWEASRLRTQTAHHPGLPHHKQKRTTAEHPAFNKPWLSARAQSPSVKLSSSMYSGKIVA